MAEFTPGEKLACVRRELALRRNVYPGFVARGKMKQSAADKEIAVIESIVDDYQKQVEWAADKSRPF